jgi:diguanylate cyclase (GGDEF)-like protein/PAS domain S-box-containing protein
MSMQRRRPLLPAESIETAPAASLVADYPGPAALLSPGGAVAAANDLAGPMLGHLAVEPGVDALARLRTPATETIAFAGASGPITIELAILPSEAGVLLLGRDISLAANLRNALVDSRLRYKDLVEVSSDFAWEANEHGRFDFVSPRGALGWPAAELVGRTADSLIHVDPLYQDHPDLRPPSPFATRAPIEQQETWIKRADDGMSCVLVSAVPVFDADGVWRGARGVWRDVTEDRARDAALAEARNRERMLAHVARVIRDEVEPEAILEAAATTAMRALGADGARLYRITDQNGQSAAASHGGTALPELDECVRRCSGALSGDLFARAVAWNLPSGRALAAITSYRRARNGALAVWRNDDQPDWTQSERTLIEDIASQLGIAFAQIDHHRHLETLARTDGLTGLNNKRTFTRLLDRRVETACAGGRGFALIYVDLDNFKLVNDRFGHERGDLALKAVAAALARIVRAGDAVARLGGDEFALLVDDLTPDAAEMLAQRLLAIKAELADFTGDRSRPLGLSAGVALFDPLHPESAAALTKRADAAMYRAKRAGKDRFAIAPQVQRDGAAA